MVLGIVLPLLVLTKLTDEVWQKQGFGWDFAGLRAVHRLVSADTDTVMIGVTNVGGSFVLIPLTLGVVLTLLSRRRRTDALFVGSAVVGAMLIVLIAKLGFARDRPTLWAHQAEADGYSFPSGHAMGSMALAAALVALLWSTRWRWPAFAGAALLVAAVGYSRLYLGVHYPSDVLAGWAFSLVWVTGLHVLMFPARRTTDGAFDSARIRGRPPGRAWRHRARVKPLDP